MNSRGVAFWWRSGALYFEGLRGLILVNSRGVAFWRCSGALYFEGLRDLILVNSRGFALWSFVFKGSEELNPREFTRVCALELYFRKALVA